MRIFVDMDGTLAKWNNVEFEQLFEEGYYRNLEPNIELLNEVKTLINNGEDVYVLSAYLTESDYALDDKKEWLKEHLSELSENHQVFVPYGTNKAAYLRDNYSPITNQDYLIDDYTQNLLEWKEFGGIGVKYLNGINHTRGTWNGLMINQKKHGFIEVEDNSLYNLILSEKLKDNNITMISSLSDLNSVSNYNNRDYRACTIKLDGIVHYFQYNIDRKNMNLNNEISTINEIIFDIKDNHQKFDSQKSVYGVDFNDYYKAHYPSIYNLEGFEKLREELSPKLLDDIEYSVYLYGCDNSYKYIGIDDAREVYVIADNSRLKSMYIDWYDKVLSTEELLNSLNGLRVDELITENSIATPDYEDVTYTKYQLKKEINIVQTFINDYLLLYPKSNNIDSVEQFIRFAQSLSETIDEKATIPGIVHQNYTHSLELARKEFINFKQNVFPKNYTLTIQDLFDLNDIELDYIPKSDREIEILENVLRQAHPILNPSGTIAADVDMPEIHWRIVKSYPADDGFRVRDFLENKKNEQDNSNAMKKDVNQNQKNQDIERNTY